MIKELQKFPKKALCHAYEGEDTGVSIRWKDGCGFIKATENPKKNDDSTSAQKLSYNMIDNWKKS